MASFSEESFHSHLLRRHLFLTSRFSIPRPPWSFGLQMISHLASRYFLLSSSPCQKKRDRQKFCLFLTPTGTSKNDRRNIGILVSTEFIRINRPPYDMSLPFQQLIFFSNRSSMHFHSLFVSLRWWIGIPR